MILIPEQISGIRKNLEIETSRDEAFKEYYKDQEYVNSPSTSVAQVGDGITNDSHSMTINNKRRYYHQLLDSEYLTERNLETIAIGTKFTVLFSDEEEEETYMLVEELSGVNQLDGYVSLQGLFGTAVYGKKEKDTFEFKLPHGVTTGEIIEIKKDPKEYVHFIREKGIEHRLSYIEKKRLSNLRKIMATDENARKEYEDYKMITKSQKEILELEYSKLERKYRKNDPSARNRFVFIKNTLNESKIAPLPTDDTIGIGTKFKIKFLLPEEKDVEVEMINKAVATETTDVYVERISSLGTRLFGLTENQEFSYFNGKEHIAGFVYEINNGKTKKKDYTYLNRTIFKFFFFA